MLDFVGKSLHRTVSLLLHTNMHNWLLQHFTQEYDPTSCITYDVCVNFIHDLWDLTFKVDSEQ